MLYQSSVCATFLYDLTYLLRLSSDLGSFLTDEADRYNRIGIGWLAVCHNHRLGSFDFYFYLDPTGPPQSGYQYNQYQRVRSFCGMNQCRDPFLYEIFLNSFNSSFTIITADGLSLLNCQDLVNSTALLSCCDNQSVSVQSESF